MRPPEPRREHVVGHLGRWANEPLTMLDEGAALGDVFGLRLWRRAVVGFTPDWNRLVLGDIATFRSRGSMSSLSPHLNGGVVHTDEPAHRDRRRHLNPSFARRSVESLRPLVTELATERLPRGDFDAIGWSSTMVRAALSSCFFGDRLPAGLLDAFLAPLDRAMPLPLLRRPVLFRRMDHALSTALAAAPEGCLAAAFRDLPDGVEEVRVAISAAYDTTAHTMSWVLYHAAREPRLLAPDMHELLVNEVLRLYPAGWLGSRRNAVDVRVGDIDVPAGTLVMFSPYLTHRDPRLWPDPLQFRPERFLEPLPAWGYVPFAAGERTCLGSSLARLVLTSVLEAFVGSTLAVVDADPSPRAAITLAPTGPLRLRRTLSAGAAGRRGDGVPVGRAS